MTFKNRYTLLMLLTLGVVYSTQPMDENIIPDENKKVSFIDISGVPFLSNANKLGVIKELIQISLGQEPQKCPASYDLFCHMHKEKEKEIGKAIEEALFPCIQHITDELFYAGIDHRDLKLHHITIPFYMKAVKTEVSLTNIIQNYPILDCPSGLYRTFFTANKYGIKLKDVKGKHAYDILQKIIHKNENPITELYHLLSNTDFNPNEALLAKLGASDELHQTSLFFLALCEYSKRKPIDVTPMIKLFLRYNANINYTCVDRKNTIVETPVTFLVKWTHSLENASIAKTPIRLYTENPEKFIRFLIDNDGDFNIEDYRHQTAFEALLLRNRMYISKFLDVALNKDGKKIKLTEQTLNRAFAIIKQYAQDPNPIHDEESLKQYMPWYTMDPQHEPWLVYEILNRNFKIDHTNLIVFTNKVIEVAPQSPLLKEIKKLHSTVQSSVLPHELETALREKQLDKVLSLLDKERLLWLSGKNTNIYLHENPKGLSLINNVIIKRHYREKEYSTEEKKKLDQILDKLISYPANPCIVDEDNALPFKEPKLSEKHFNLLKENLYPFIEKQTLPSTQAITTVLLCIKKLRQKTKQIMPKPIIIDLLNRIYLEQLPLKYAENKSIVLGIEQMNTDKKELKENINTLVWGEKNNTQHDVIIQKMKELGIDVGEKKKRK